MRTTIAAAALSLASVASAQNLLNNASFESPIAFDFADLSNWNGFFGGPAGVILQNFNDTGAAARTGNNALLMSIRGNPAVTLGHNSFVGHIQAVAVTGGTEYEYAVWARTDGAFNNQAEFRIEWQDSNNAEISRTNVVIGGQLTSEYQRFAFAEFAPTNAARAIVVLAVESFTNNGALANSRVAWDDASFTVVPAPAAAAMLGLGGLVAGRRRR